MLIKEYLEQEALTFENYEDAATVQKILIENGYCVMMSREEHLWLLNWVWTENFANRNDVIFINRAQYECDEWKWLENHPEYREEEE